MYLIFLIFLMLVFTICISIIISKRKNNVSLSDDKLTDDVKEVISEDNNVIVDEDII